VDLRGARLVEIRQRHGGDLSPAEVEELLRPRVLTSGLAAPSMNVARAHPCEAGGIGPHASLCGATPASVWRRRCGNGHERDVRLCGQHASLISQTPQACRDCLDRGVACVAVILPVDLLLLGHAGVDVRSE
jgi:hypothetical protein